MTYGRLDVLEYVSGLAERLPVLIAQGRKDGLTRWITANIHSRT
jgi:hypothetical protein